MPIRRRTHQCMMRLLDILRPAIHYLVLITLWSLTHFILKLPMRLDVGMWMIQTKISNLFQSFRFDIGVRPPWTYPDVEPVGLFILDLISHLALSDQRLGSAMRHYKVFDVLRDYSTEWLSALLSEFVTDKMVADIREGRIADDA